MNIDKDSKDISLDNQNRLVTAEYTNWRGQTSWRRFIPTEILWGKTEWHHEEQWLLKAWDLDKEDYRFYALKDFKSWK